MGNFATRRGLTLLLFLLVETLKGDVVIAPFSLNLSQLGGPAAVTGTTVVSGANFAYGLATTSNGSLLFGQSLPTTSYGLYYGNGPAVGSVWMAPKQADGTFGAPTKLIDNLPGVVTDVRTLSDGTILVDSGTLGVNTRTMSFYTPSGQQIGQMAFSNTAGGWEHGTGMSYVQTNADGTSTIYFNVGSQSDQAQTTATVTTSGLTTATLNGDAVYRMTIASTGSSISIVSAPTQVVTGVRNPFGLAVDSAGNLIVGDNGIDGAHVHDELGADTLSLVTAFQLASQVTNLGFPDSYINFRTGAWVNGSPGAQSPLTGFLPVADANGALQSSEGISGLAYLTPGSLPFVGAEGGVIATFHGVFDAGGVANYDNAVEYYDFASGTYVPIVDAGTAGVGHLDSVLVQGHVLYLEEFTQTGLVNGYGGLAGGDIYAFDFSASYAPEPPTWITEAGVLATVGLCRSFRQRRNRLQ